MLRRYLIILSQPRPASVEAALAAVRSRADIIDTSLGERGVELGARLGGASAERGFFGRGRLEQIGGERQHAAGEGHVRPHHAVTGAAAFDPFREAAGPPQRERGGVGSGFGLRHSALRQYRDEAPPLGHAVLALRDRALRFRGSEDHGQRRGVVGEQNVGHAAGAQLRADRHIPKERQGKWCRRTAATQDRLKGRGGIEHGVDGAGLQRLVGFASFRDIHPRDLVHQTGEVAAGELTMDDWPDHASLLTSDLEASLVPVIYLCYSIPYARNRFPTLWTPCSGKLQSDTATVCEAAHASKRRLVRQADSTRPLGVPRRSV